MSSDDWSIHSDDWFIHSDDWSIHSEKIRQIEGKWNKFYFTMFYKSMGECNTILSDTLLHYGSFPFTSVVGSESRPWYFRHLTVTYFCLKLAEDSDQ